MLVLSSSSALAVDIGGTKLVVAIVDREAKVIAEWREATPPGSDPELLWSRLEELILKATQKAEADSLGLAVCGVGCGGPMRRAGSMVSPLNIPAWRDFPLRDRLQELTGLVTYVDNDAKALALAEGWVGAAVQQSNYLSMVVSTGVGAGIVLDGRLLEGADGNAGHLGHLTVVQDGRPCACGARGCLEAEASGTAIQLATGRPAAEADLDWRQRTGALVGKAVAAAANLLDLRLATVSGSVALGFGEPFFSAAQSEMDRSCRLDFSRGVRILPSPLGLDGPTIGAAAVGFSKMGLL